MLILVLSSSDNFISRHEYAITAEGHECICVKRDDEAINYARTMPVDVIYLHTQSIGKDINRLMFILNAFKGSIILGSTDLDSSAPSDAAPIKGLNDIIFTCNDDPRPLISKLRNLCRDAELSNTDLKKSSLQTYAINDASFNWNFSCHADIEAIRESDILERVTRATQFFQIPTGEHRNILIILTELYNNAVDHGVLGLPSQLKQDADGFAKFYELRLNQLNKRKTGFIDIELVQKVLGPKTKLSITVKDSGKGFDYDQQFNSDLSNNPYGRGLNIINKLSKSVEYRGCGNEVMVVYEWPI